MAEVVAIIIRLKNTIYFWMLLFYYYYLSIILMLPHAWEYRD